mgnify:CR=1 FL=1
MKNKPRILALRAANPLRWSGLLSLPLFAWLVWQADRGALPGWVGGLVALPGMDKVLHFTLVGVLAWCVNLGLSWRRLRLFSRELLLGSLLVFGLATLEEFSQAFLSLRDFSWLDLAANYLGIYAAGLFAGRPKDEKQG